MLKSTLVALVMLLGAVCFVQPTEASGGGGVRIRLEARMRSGATEAKVSYREEVRNGVTRRWVQAEINRATPSTSFPIFHKGRQIGTVTTNALGVGNVEFERGVTPMVRGDAVGIGRMTGTLQPR